MLVDSRLHVGRQDPYAGDQEQLRTGTQVSQGQERRRKERDYEQEGDGIAQGEEGSVDTVEDQEECTRMRHFENGEQRTKEEHIQFISSSACPSHLRRTLLPMQPITRIKHLLLQKHRKLRNHLLALLPRPNRNPQARLAADLVPTVPHYNLLLSRHLRVHSQRLGIVRLPVRPNLGEEEVGVPCSERAEHGGKGEEG